MDDLELFAELEAREQIRDRVLAATFPKQREFILSPARRGSVLCTRRAGKSMGAALKLLLVAQMNPGSLLLFLTITKTRAKDILWDVLKAWVQKLRIQGADWNESELRVKFANGSSIKLSGADADNREKEKVLGLPYDLVIIDECASFRTNLRALITSSLQPAMIDKRGAIWLIGTPGDFIGSKDVPQFFYAVTNEHKELSRGWAPTLKWSAYDNPHMATQWAEDVARIEAEEPLFKETPIYKQMWLGQWAIDETKLVYRYNEKRNLIARADVPAGVVGRVISVDLGFNDDTAFAVGGWKPYTTTLYILSAEKEPGLIFAQVAERLEKLRAAHPDAMLVIDGANKQGVQELIQRYNLPLELAEKTGKNDYIRLMNSDMIMGKVKVVDGACGPLIEEWSALIWDDRALVRREKPGAANHACDAALYLWRRALSYREENEPTGEPPPFSEAAIAEFWRKRGEQQRREEEDGFFG